jgi:hypothetical protein
MPQKSTLSPGAMTSGTDLPLAARTCSFVGLNGCDIRQQTSFQAFSVLPGPRIASDDHRFRHTAPFGRRKEKLLLLHQLRLQPLDTYQSSGPASVAFHKFIYILMQ